MDKEKAIDALKEKLTELKNISTIPKFNDWTISAKNTLLFIFPDAPNPLPIPRLINMSNTSNGSNMVSEFRQKAETILNSYISDIDRFGLQIKKGKEDDSQSPFTVNVNQSNHQSTSVNINLTLIIESLKDELTGGQVKELKSIIDSQDKPEEKKKNFIDKFKSFGNDVASNILANIITNPDVYSSLGGML